MNSKNFLIFLRKTLDSFSGKVLYSPQMVYAEWASFPSP